MSANESNTLLEDRYGRGKKRSIDRRIAWSIGVGAVIIGVTFLLFGGWQQGSSIEFKTLSYEVIDEQTATATLQVTAPPGSEVACALEAKSASKATVGWKIVVLPASEKLTRGMTEPLVTTTLATTATTRHCWLLE